MAHWDKCLAQFCLWFSFWFQNKERLGRWYASASEYELQEEAKFTPSRESLYETTEQRIQINCRRLSSSFILWCASGQRKWFQADLSYWKEWCRVHSVVFGLCIEVLQPIYRCSRRQKSQYNSQREPSASVWAHGFLETWRRKISKFIDSKQIITFKNEIIPQNTRWRHPTKSNCQTKNRKEKLQKSNE